MIKESIQKKDITIINIHISKVRAPKYIKQTLTDMKGEINSNTIIGDSNTQSLIMKRTSKQKINKKQMNLTYWELSTQQQKDTHPSQEHRDIVQGRSHVHLKKCKKIEIISDHNETKLEIISEKIGKFTNTWKLNNILVNNIGWNRKSKGNLKNI